MDLAAVSTCLPDALQGLENKKCYRVAAPATALGGREEGSGCNDWHCKILQSEEGTGKQWS